MTNFAEVVALLTGGGGEASLRWADVPHGERMALDEAAALTAGRGGKDWPVRHRLAVEGVVDLLHFYEEIPGVGSAVGIGRIATYGVSHAGQASWFVYCEPCFLGQFWAPETATTEELAAWATLTVTALRRTGAVIVDRSTGRLVLADQTSRS